ncbi:Beta-barrel assembly machine subunit BamC [Stenotrophomonas maltophilia]|nr:Beta-barrel assembly machine subunit BamC [Stenotrophomonas maltophilia]
MRQSVSAVRLLSFALIALTTVVTTTGCFKRGAKGDYALAPEMRPLEVPPDLNLPSASGENQVPRLASTTAPAAAAAAAPAAPAVGNTGFTIPGSKDEAFAKVGTALEGVQGVTIASRAQLLGSYDVAYGGSNFLVRVVAVDAGAYVSAVDPRGLPATAEAPVKLIAALKAALAK